MNKSQGSKSASLGDSSQIINAIREKEIEKFRKESAIEIAKTLIRTSTDRSLKNGKVRLVGWGTYKVPKEIMEANVPKLALIIYLIRKASEEDDVDWLMKAVKVHSVSKTESTVPASDDLTFKLTKKQTEEFIKTTAEKIVDLNKLKAKTDQKDTDVEENQWFFSLFDKIGVTKIEGESLSSLTVQQLRTLAYIAKAGTEGVLAADMEDALDVSLSSIQRQVGRLSKKGYSFKTRGQEDRVRKGLGLIEEFQDPMNRKQSRWVLSKEGVKFFKSLNSVL